MIEKIILLVSYFILCSIAYSLDGHDNEMSKTISQFHTAKRSDQLSAALQHNKKGRTQYRNFFIRSCGYNITLSSIYYVYAAHQIEWNIMGREMPWFSVLTGYKRTKTITSEKKDEFYRSGTEWVNTVKTFVGDFSFTNKRVLDFGCGLGRLAFAFANDHNAHVTCVDQSVHHLRIANKEWIRRRQNGNVDFVLSSPDLILAVEGKKFDFIHSIIVLQHMVPALQVVYMEQFCDSLAHNGIGWLQIPYISNSKRSGDGCNLENSITVGGMQMHGTPMKYIQELFEERGCKATITDVGGKYVGDCCKSAEVLFWR